MSQLGGLGKLDKLANKVSKDLIKAFGGTGKIVINTPTFSNGFSADPIVSKRTFDNIALTPPNVFTEYAQEGTLIASRFIEVFIHVSQVSENGVLYEPTAHDSILTIYQGSFVDAEVLNKNLSIKEVNPIMGGNKVVMYQLKCEGAH